jgi:hypothetical protein
MSPVAEKPHVHIFEIASHGYQVPASGAAGWNTHFHGLPFWYEQRGSCPFDRLGEQSDTAKISAPAIM